MKKLLIVIAAVCYCVSPDLFYGPVDDAIAVLASMAYVLRSPEKDRVPNYVKHYMNMNKDF